MNRMQRGAHAMGQVRCEKLDLLLHVGVSDRLAIVRRAMPAFLEGRIFGRANGTLPNLTFCTPCESGQNGRAQADLSFRIWLTPAGII